MPTSYSRKLTSKGNMKRWILVVIVLAVGYTLFNVLLRVFSPMSIDFFSVYVLAMTVLVTWALNTVNEFAYSRWSINKKVEKTLKKAKSDE